MIDIKHKDIKDAIVYSDLYERLSDKTDNINLKKRSVNNYILSNLSIGFSKEFNLNPEMAELIVYARDVAYPTFGELTYEFLRQKNSNFNRFEISIDFLKREVLQPNNLEMPQELELAIADSFNIGEDNSKEGRLVYLLENTIYTAQMNRENTKKSLIFKNKLEEIWQRLQENQTFETQDEICKYILLLTDTMIENGNVYGEKL